MFRFCITAIPLLLSTSPSGIGCDEPQPLTSLKVAPAFYDEATIRTEADPAFKHLQKIGLALHGYHDIFGRFPPAVSYGPDGTTPYSWRVELLPVLKHYANQIDPQTDISNRPAYDAAIAACGYDTSQTWESPHNQKVLASIPKDYRHPMDDEQSTDSGFYAVVGNGTVFDTNTISHYEDIRLWPASTLMIAEYQAREPWTKPIDIQYSPLAVVPRFGGFSKSGFMSLTADGAVHFVADLVSPADLKAFMTTDQTDKFQIPGIPHRYGR